MNQREVGTRQESRAAEYLESLGYHILVRNFRCRFGEIDLEIGPSPIHRQSFIGHFV